MTGRVCKSLCEDGVQDLTSRLRKSISRRFLYTSPASDALSCEPRLTVRDGDLQNAVEGEDARNLRQLVFKRNVDPKS